MSGPNSIMDFIGSKAIDGVHWIHHSILSTKRILNYAKLERQPRVFQNLTGLSLAAFAQLLPAFEQAYVAAQDIADAQREQARERQRGGGRKATLATVADKLVFILFYFRLYPTQAAQGFFFGISQGQACTWIHRLTPVLNQALGSEQQLQLGNHTRHQHHSARITPRLLGLLCHLEVRRGTGQHCTLPASGPASCPYARLRPLRFAAASPSNAANAIPSSRSTLPTPTHPTRHQNRCAWFSSSRDVT